jgi:hypothetical protein
VEYGAKSKEQGARSKERLPGFRLEFILSAAEGPDCQY